MADFLGKLWKAKKNGKYKSYNSLIGMDGKVKYPRFLLCKKLHEKIPIIGGITIFLKVSRTAVYCKTAKGGQKENVQKWPIFCANFARLKKWEIQVI